MQNDNPIQKTTEQTSLTITWTIKDIEQAYLELTGAYADELEEHAKEKFEKFLENNMTKISNEIVREANKIIKDKLLPHVITSLRHS